MKFKLINAQTGWKYYSYNEKLQSLYLIAWLSKRIELVENIDLDSFKVFEKSVNKHSKKKITLWIDNVQDRQGMKIETATNELIKAFEYNIPNSFLYGLQWNIIKETIRLNNAKQLSDFSFFKKRKLLKDLCKEFQNNFYKK